MANATKFWTAQNVTPATCYTTASTTAATCDGNGDGQIWSVDVGITYSESFRAWQHLANASLIEGRYTGVTGSGGPVHGVPGSNVPKARVANGGFTMWWWPNYVSDGNAYDGAYGNLLFIGGAQTADVTHAPIFKPEEAWNIDTKLDDGKPAYGAIRSFKTTSSNAPNCTTSSTSSVAEYKLSDSGINCALSITLGF